MFATIAAALTTTISNTTSKPSHLKGLPLIHPLSSEYNFEISLLIGADFYWDPIGDHIIRRDGSIGVAIPSARIVNLYKGILFMFREFWRPVVYSNNE